VRLSLFKLGLAVCCQVLSDVGGTGMVLKTDFYPYHRQQPKVVYSGADAVNNKDGYHPRDFVQKMAWIMDKEIQFLMYSTPQGDVNVEAVVRDETLWLTQKAMAQLFGVQVPAINKHLKNIFAEGELHEEVVISKMEITTQHGAIEGKTQTLETQFYNLDAIISVGYRVNSAKATHFRIWATNVLKEYMLKGFVLDDERLKQGGEFAQYEIVSRIPAA
jgi:hypothetical protein